MSGPDRESAHPQSSAPLQSVDSSGQMSIDPYSSAARGQSSEVGGHGVQICQADPGAAAAGQAAELRRLEEEGAREVVGRFARVYQAQPFLILRGERDPRPIVSRENLADSAAARAQAQEDTLTRALLAVNDRVLVIARYPDNWVQVRTDDGEVGFVDEARLMIGPPHPDAVLHHIEAGETALGIAGRYYDCTEWGRDARFYTNVLEHLNNGSQTGERAGFYRSDPSADWADTELRAGYWAWIPPKSFADQLHGVLPSGSISYELVGAARDTAAFTVGCLAGALQAVTDIVMDVVELFGLVWDVVGSVIDGTLLDDIGDLIADIANIDIEQLLGAFAAHWNAPDAWDRWYNRGEIIGLVVATVIIEVLMAVFTLGAANAARWAARAGRLGPLMDWLKASRFGRRVMNRAEDAADAKPDLDRLEELTDPSRRRQREREHDRDRDEQQDRDNEGPPRLTLREVDELIATSEGRPGASVKRDGSRPVGHAEDHIPAEGASDADVRALARGRPHKQNTTVYQQRIHAQRDLRNVLNDNAAAVADLQPGQRLSLSGSSVNYRRGYNSVQGGEPVLVEWRTVTVTVERLDDGTLHLAHFSPSEFIPVVTD